MKTWIVYFCLSLCPEPDGKIAITESSVQAFAITWKVITEPVGHVRYNKAQIVSAELHLKSPSGNIAHITIKGETITFTIAEKGKIVLKQLNYEILHP